MSGFKPPKDKNQEPDKWHTAILPGTPKPPAPTIGGHRRPLEMDYTSSTDGMNFLSSPPTLTRGKDKKQRSEDEEELTGARSGDAKDAPKEFVKFRDEMLKLAKSCFQPRPPAGVSGGDIKETPPGSGNYSFTVTLSGTPGQFAKFDAGAKQLRDKYNNAAKLQAPNPAQEKVAPSKENENQLGQKTTQGSVAPTNPDTPQNPPHSPFKMVPRPGSGNY